MTDVNSLGFGLRSRRVPDAERITEIVVQRPLGRVLAFVGCSIHDVINNPFIRNQVRGYWKLYKQVNRTCEIIDLERQWNPSAPEKRVKKS